MVHESFVRESLACEAQAISNNMCFLSLTTCTYDRFCWFSRCDFVPANLLLACDGIIWLPDVREKHRGLPGSAESAFRRHAEVLPRYMFSLAFYVFFDMHMSVYIYTHMFVCVYIFTYRHIYLYIYMRVCVFAHMYIYIYIHIDIYRFMYAYMYLYTCLLFLFLYLFIHVSICIYIYICLWCFWSVHTSMILNGPQW